jgi:hypothetical protein
VATLNIGYGWVAGDVERILLALEIRLGRYSIHEMTVCCNELGDMSPSQVSKVRTLLDEWERALGQQKNAGDEENAGKVLVKADVLEWEVDNGGKYEAIVGEKTRVRHELEKIFGFCPLIGDGMGSVGTLLYRS